MECDMQTVVRDQMTLCMSEVYDKSLTESRNSRNRQTPLWNGVQLPLTFLDRFHRKPASDTLRGTVVSSPSPAFTKEKTKPTRVTLEDKKLQKSFWRSNYPHYNPHNEPPWSASTHWKAEKESQHTAAAILMLSMWHLYQYSSSGGHSP